MGELNTELAGYFQGLRPRYRTALLDDLEANVVAARQLGMRAVLFHSTAQAIADLEACLAESAS